MAIFAAAGSAQAGMPQLWGPYSFHRGVHKDVRNVRGPRLLRRCPWGMHHITNYLRKAERPHTQYTLPTYNALNKRIPERLEIKIDMERTKRGLPLGPKSDVQLPVATAPPTARAGGPAAAAQTLTAIADDRLRSLIL